MCRLTQGLPEEHLAHLFKVSVSTVSRVFITWLNFMYLRLGQINIWPSRTAIEITMPEDFKKKNIHRPELLLTARKLSARCQLVYS